MADITDVNMMLDHARWYSDGRGKVHADIDVNGDRRALCGYDLSRAWRKSGFVMDCFRCPECIRAAAGALGIVR